VQSLTMLSAVALMPTMARVVVDPRLLMGPQNHCKRAPRGLRFALLDENKAQIGMRVPGKFWRGQSRSHIHQGRAT
jgi:hypothetical protein